MQALMLAAGMGKRLLKYTNDQTKCMLSVAGKTLLERTIDALKGAGVNKLVLVVGFKSAKVIKFVTENIAGIKVEFVYNADYEKTNNIYSLYLARDFLRRDDTILLESDLIYEDSIIYDLVKSPVENLAVVSKYEYWMDGTVCTLDRDGNILDFVSKNDFSYSDADKYYKTVNIYKFSKKFSAEKYIPFLETYIQVYGVNQYYESVLKIISHINKMDIGAFDIGQRKWYEIDNSHDLDIAETIFMCTNKKFSAYEMHYGGYWRFPKVYDYCYLVNPYFPTEKMKQQLKFMFDDLLTQYPSGMRVQKLNAARALSIDEDQLLVGNGAAELINVLGGILKGKIVMPSPIFNEYLRCFKNCEHIEVQSNVDGFPIDVDRLIEFIPTVDAIVLVNPDNPSGDFVTQELMMKIITMCHENETICIVDESFVDFCEKELRYTLLDSNLLQKNPELVVIKSISKSYGVPGLRLGVMATGNTSLLREVACNMPIWNINSFGEYFWNILPLHKREYILSCNKLADERRRLINELKNISYLKPYPSQANYVLCEVIGRSSRALCNDLVDRFDILIKDLSSKTGINGKQYIRIAVRDEKDNNYLLEKLSELEE